MLGESNEFLMEKTQERALISFNDGNVLFNKYFDEKQLEKELETIFWHLGSKPREDR